jgi:hypothetical protein
MHIILGRPTIRTYLPGLPHNSLQLLPLNPLDLDQQLDPQPHIRFPHAAHQVHRALDDRVLWRTRHLDTQPGRGHVHGGLEACAVTRGEELFRVRLAFVAGPAERFGHGQVDFEVFALDVAGNC